jgi:hypothetical protein
VGSSDEFGCENLETGHKFPIFETGREEIEKLKKNWKKGIVRKLALWVDQQRCCAGR